MRYFTTRGLILKKQPSGENDWYLTIFSPEYGKIQAVSRSSRKISSHKGSHLETLNLCEFQLYKNGDRFLITECKVENAYLAIKSDLDKSAACFAILEVLLRSIQSDNQNTELFLLTLKTLDQLNNELDQVELEEYKIRLLKDGGSWPDLARCHYCLETWTETSLIACDQLGHLSCESCLHLSGIRRESYPYKIIKLAKYLSEEGHAKMKIVITKQQLFQLKKLVSLFMQNYLQQELKSEKIFL